MAHTEAHSHVRGTADSPLSDLTIAAWLAATATLFPNRLALVCVNNRHSWMQCDEESLQAVA
jgi:hypothetical protein